MPTIRDTARGELGTSLTSNRQRVAEYVQKSGGSTSQMEGRSWCGDFAFWVLDQAKISPLPDRWQSRPYPQGSNAIPRFFDRYGTTTHPLPGDMYYRPYIMGLHGIQDVEHVGFIEDPDWKPGFMRSIDGNGGGAGANWSLGLGGGVVSQGEPPLAGATKIHKFIPVVSSIDEPEGRWEVTIGVYTWHYIFRTNPGGDNTQWSLVLCTDLNNTTNARFVGSWKLDGSVMRISWSKVNTDEEWTLPLIRKNQPGKSTNKNYTLTATKIETKKRVDATPFTFNVD
jgi:hypothetical protein